MADVEGGEITIGLVGGNGGEAVAVLVVEGLLRPGMQRFAAHDQPRAGRERRQVDQAGGLGHASALADFAVLAARRCPRARIGVQRPDGNPKLLGQAHADGKAHLGVAKEG